MKCFCIGRNYPLHAQELGNPIPQEPIIFLKPHTAILPPGKPFQIPDFSHEIHYECEVVIQMHHIPANAKRSEIHSYIKGIGLGIDFTARDLQQKLKTQGLPWELAKAFDGSAAISPLLPPHTVTMPITFALFRNGHCVQQGNTKDMCFPIDELIRFISRYFTIEEGDLLFTGTPPGVGKVESGDHLEGYLNGQKLLDVKII
jgi:2-keto-4-pentenoate hydratase/2-oxohepta-3-ene-1,7-dioic acid hydratase in catechol pathway